MAPDPQSSTYDPLDYKTFRRRIIPRPIKPAPSRAQVPGSGTLPVITSFPHVADEKAKLEVSNPLMKALFAIKSRDTFKFVGPPVETTVEVPVPINVAPVVLPQTAWFGR